MSSHDRENVQQLVVGGCYVDRAELFAQCFCHSGALSCFAVFYRWKDDFEFVIFFLVFIKVVLLKVSLVNPVFFYILGSSSGCERKTFFFFK